MSFVIGTISGALAAGGAYYGFSNLMQSRTNAHRADLNRLSNLLTSPPPTSTGIPAPPPAAERICHSQLGSYIKGRWNEEISGLVGTVRKWENGVEEWGRKWIYGGGH